MRYCFWCNTSFGQQELADIEDGHMLHARCLAPYRLDKRIKESRPKHRLLHLPSLREPCADEPAR